MCIRDSLKELSLTEGRNTGIPTIQNELALNGSPQASFVTDDDRLSFLVRIPCHEGEEGIPNLAIGTHIIPKETVEIPKETGENPKETEEIPKETEEIPKENELSGLQLDILRIIKKNPAITLQSLSLQLGVTIDKIRYQRTQLEKKGIFLCRKGATKKGTWESKFD